MDKILSLSRDIRYVAIYRNNNLESESRAGTEGASSSESDHYEEILVNPTLLKLASQRGNIDCGGLDYLIIKYGNFFQFILPMEWGHISVCIEKNADPVLIGRQVIRLIESQKDYL